MTVLDHDWYPDVVPANVTIGRGSWIWSSYAFAHYRSERPVGVSIGAHSGVYITTFFDLGPRGEVTIGDYCTLVGVTISTNERVEIGDHAFVSKPVTIADSFAAIPPSGADDRDGEPRTVVSIGPNAWVGASVILLPGARLGEGSIVGAATVVDCEVPPYAIVAGSPMRIIGWGRPKP